ncbi:dual-specificity kinase family protein [Kocuria palustris]|nr:dual-specificity kinase family protein [Kocuria palustris]
MQSGTQLKLIHLELSDNALMLSLLLNADDQFNFSLGSNQLTLQLSQHAYGINNHATQLSSGNQNGSFNANPNKVKYRRPRLRVPQYLGHDSLVDAPMLQPSDDEDIVLMEERGFFVSAGRNNLDSLLYDYDSLSAYNMFNVHNQTPLIPYGLVPPGIDSTVSNGQFSVNTFDHHKKKQRTNSLPQLPQVKCFYHKLPNNYVIQTPKLGNVKTNVIPHQRNLPPCDDDQGHYIIKINEVFANRFVIIKLLGQGTFGKVVQAYDKVNRQHVAIKIIRNIQKYRDAARIELRILSTLKKFDNDNLNHCLHLRECFDYRGHICIVTDLLKQLLYDFLELNKFIAFPGSQIQAIAKQLIRSVTFLHDLNLIHTDLKPENILLHDDGYSKKPLTLSTLITAFLAIQLLQKHHSLPKVPRTLRILSNPLIQIIDFGLGIFDDEYHSLIVLTRHYRAPEIVLGTGWSFPCDCWSIGCILVELVIGEPLFKTHDNLEHLAMIEKVCGYPIDKLMVQLSKEKGNECGLEYFTKAYIPDAHRMTDGEEEDDYSGDCDDDVIFDDVATLHHLLRLMFPTLLTPEKFVKLVAELDRIDVFISKRIGLDINFDYSLLLNYQKNKHLMNFGNFTFWWFFIDLLKKLFIINPEERLTALEALNHPWFNLGIEDEGTV